MSAHLADIDYAAYPHILQAHDGPDVRCLGNVHACVGNRQALPRRHACLAFLYACGPRPSGTTGRVAAWSPPNRETGSGAAGHTALRSHDTCGDVRARLGWEAGPRAAGHMAAPKPTSAGRQDPVLQDTWRRLGACPAPSLDLKLIRRGTRSARYL
jgi:hypothetical protein